MVKRHVGPWVLLLLAGAPLAYADTPPLLDELHRRVRAETRVVEDKEKPHYFARPVTLTVDGRLDEWSGSDVIALDKPKDNTPVPPPAEDFTGYAMVGWNPAEPSRLYVAVAVTDDLRQDTHAADASWFHDDCVEFIVDFKNERQKGSALQHAAGAGGKDLSGACAAQNTHWAVTHDGPLTVIELSVDYARDNPYRAGAGLDFRAFAGEAIGFSIGYDDGDQGIRQSQMGWTRGTTWDPANWGYLVFADQGALPARIIYGASEIRLLELPPAPRPLPADTPLRAPALFVSLYGDDANPGTQSKPLATLEAAVLKAKAGTTIYLSGGVHRPRATVRLEADGTAGEPMRISGLPGEVPILDFSDAGVGPDRRGIEVLGDWWHLLSLVVEGAGDNGIFVQGAHNTIERVVTRRNQDSGLQLHTGAAHNLVLDCDSYYNYDAANHGENADGFAAKFDLGEGNVFRTCRAWNNSDDGWDLWQAGKGVRIESCWSFENGLDFWGDKQFSGDGNGFKLGQGAGAHVLIRCTAAANREHGFDVNGNESGVRLLHCSTWRNNGAGFHFDDNLPHSLLNNLALANRVLIGSGARAEGNSWSLAIGPTSADFEALDVQALRDYRGSSGSLPSVAFLRPTSASALIDAGAAAGLPYLGRAPDIGAYEVR